MRWWVKSHSHFVAQKLCSLTALLISRRSFAHWALVSSTIDDEDPFIALGNRDPLFASKNNCRKFVDPDWHAWGGTRMASTSRAYITAIVIIVLGWCLIRNIVIIAQFIIHSWWRYLREAIIKQHNKTRTRGHFQFSLFFSASSHELYYINLRLLLLSHRQTIFTSSLWCGLANQIKIWQFFLNSTLMGFYFHFCTNQQSSTDPLIVSSWFKAPTPPLGWLLLILSEWVVGTAAATAAYSVCSDSWPV